MKTISIIFAYLLIFSMIVKGQNTCDRYFSTELTYHNNSLDLHYDNFPTGNDYRIFHRTNEPVNTSLNVIDIKKPIIILEGYDIFQSESCQDIYDKYLNNSGPFLRANGYDIITYNLAQPQVALQLNALVFANFIDFINKNKTGNEELIIMGVSMGGLLTRYALTYMEQQGRQHQTKLFLSFDSPQQGAYAPLSMQALLTDMSVTAMSIFTSNEQLYYLIASFNSVGSQQMLTHNIRNVSNGYAHPDQKYTNFFNELTSMNACGGYPVNCKRVGISNGSLKADLQKGRWSVLGAYPTSGNPAVAFAIPIVLDLVFTRMLYTAPGTDNWLLLDEDDGTCVYQSTSQCDMGTNSYFLKADVCPPEHISGGYYPWYKALVDNLPSNAAVPIYWMENSCFISTISALDLNTNDGLLKLSNYSKNQILADSRFDDIWWDLSHDNMPHTSYDSMGSLYNFIEDQIYLSQSENYAQTDNYSLSGGSTNAGDKKLYKAVNSIIAGNHTVNNGGSLVLKSGNSIKLQPGFSVKAGATFSASIENFQSRNCNLAGNLPQFTPPSLRSVSSNIVQIDTIINGFSTSLHVPAGLKSQQAIDNKVTSVQNITEPDSRLFIFPNLAKDKITISYSNPKRQKITIQLVESISGKILRTINNSVENEGILNMPFDVSYLIRGIYVIVIQTENTIINKKFIKE